MADSRNDRYNTASNNDNGKSNKRPDSNEIVSAAIILHALGDTIGFKDGEWEFNHYDTEKHVSYDFANELLYEFITLGGVNQIDLSDWSVSDDTLWHIALAKSMIEYNSKAGIDKKFNDVVRANMIEAHEISKESKVDRAVGLMTGKMTELMATEGKDARDYGYERMGGGNGAAMRTAVIGLCLHKEEQIDELIDISITTSKMTHNNAIGYLGGFAMALFTSLAVRGVDVQEWPFILVDHLKSDRLADFIHKKISKETRDYMNYLTDWENHIENRFKNRRLIKMKVFNNPMYRLRYYYNLFTIPSYNQIGDSGILGVIMAYDAVLDSDGVWEKLIVYGMLHPGDSDTVGAMAAALFGAYYGYADVPERMYSNLEFKDQLDLLSKQIHKKYF